MSSSLKWLSMASFLNLLGNGIGTIVALQNGLAADWGGSLNGQDVLRDFLGFKGTALSAPLSFMLIQLVLTLLAVRSVLPGRIGVGGLTFVGLFYTLAQLGEPIVWRQFSSSGFDVIQSLVLLVNILSAIAMFVFGIHVWRTRRTSVAATT